LQHKGFQLFYFHGNDFLSETAIPTFFAKKPAMGIFCLFVISVKTNVFLFSFTNDSLIFFQKMKEYYQFTLV